MPLSNLNPIFDHLSRYDDSNKWSNIVFGEEIKLVASTEVNFTLLIWSSVTITVMAESAYI